jgi:hypothetical protein
METKKKRRGVRVSKDVQQIVNQLHKLNRGWVKAGCWTIDKEKIVTDKQTGEQKLHISENQVRLRKKPKSKPQTRLLGHMPDSAKINIRIKGKVGTEDRVEALAAYYQNQTDETSPFNVKYDEEVNALTAILSGIEIDEKGKIVIIGRENESSEATDRLRRANDDQGYRQVTLRKHLYKDV